MKTFESDSMAGALKQVKAELGSDAVILHTRTYRRGGVLGFGKRTVVEVTAANDVNIVPPKLRRAVLDESPAAMPRRDTGVLPSRGTAVQRAYGQSLDVETTKNHRELVREMRGASADTREADGVNAARVEPVAPKDNAVPDQVTQEIAQIRSMVHHMMRKQSTQPKPDLPDALFNEYLALLEREVTEELADEVVQNVRAKLSAKKLNDKAAVREAVGKEIARLIPVDTSTTSKTEEKAARAREGRPRTIALIGPTGVGKTTTLAKLAATFKLRDKLKVALITVDTYRIAAVDQLRTYADIINLPLHVVLTAQELRDALARCATYDVVLIDTAGRGQRDDDKLAELRGYLEVADPHEVHLVLSSTCSQGVMMQAVERFSKVRIDRIIFTKLDEAVSLGVLLNVVRRVNKQLSYITTGQEVPHQIEPGEPGRLAELILGPGL